MNADWDALASVAGVVVWILLLVVKKKRQQAKMPKTAKKRSARARRDGQVEFKRDYEPIEPK